MLHYVMLRYFTQCYDIIYDMIVMLCYVIMCNVMMYNTSHCYVVLPFTMINNNVM